MKSTSANATIPVLDKLISIFGVPKVVKTDNGSPFNSHAFKEFSENLGCQHTRITPRWPKANAQAEAFNKQMMKAVCAVHIERKNRKQDLIYSSSFANTGDTTPINWISTIYSALQSRDSDQTSTNPDQWTKRCRRVRQTKWLNCKMENKMLCEIQQLTTWSP